ncbi:glycosyltransferase [Methylomonas sp. SURF-2]|uniref:Glycosyltransferase n=1 Tax=Methylomonas subterranea TaxID=2952225 RepID=A0ABT1TCG7_9GAMM|nr:glycosyltransferase [Methylomonas sp. SURF-2]MCQ8103110.1 glycosyltransferase [Methylomonas sp. SURF-2]
MKNVLMIAYHFPPVRVSSGIQRTLKFTTYLLEHGWCAQVLTVDPRAYEKCSSDQLQEVPQQVTVKRAFALDTARHLSFKGRYSRWMALPDRWISWCLGGFFSGLMLIRRNKPRVIWSTYPIATAHLLGFLLHRATGIPWIADFRDSMTENDYPDDPLQRRVYRWIERQTINHCSRAVFTTPGAIRMYKQRYPDIADERWVLIPNGFDEENFVNAERSQAFKDVLLSKPNKIVLLHSGVIYPSERDPSHFFFALAELKQFNQIKADQLRIILRATGHDALLQRMIDECDLKDIVFLEPGIAYEMALAEMLAVDGLLIFQASNCNHQVPAKIYEYLRAGKPILALTDPVGDTAGVLFEAGLNEVVALDDKESIKKIFVRFIDGIQQKSVKLASKQTIEMHSRRYGANVLADALNSIIS